MIYKDENERWGNAPPVYEERLTQTRRWWRRTCRSLAAMASPLWSISRKLQRERERERKWGLVCALAKREKVCVLRCVNSETFLAFGFGIKQWGWYLYVLREKQRVCALFFFIKLYYILINFSVNGLGLEQCACSASRNCSSWLPRSNFESDRIAQIPNWAFIILILYWKNVWSYYFYYQLFTILINKYLNLRKVDRGELTGDEVWWGGDERATTMWNRAKEFMVCRHLHPIVIPYCKWNIIFSILYYWYLN